MARTSPAPTPLTFAVLTALATLACAESPTASEDMKPQISAARELTHACVRTRLTGRDATPEITMAKLFCGRVSRRVADECIQLHGGYGYMRESSAGRAFVDSRLIGIGGGSDETMIHYLAKQLGF